MKIFTVFFGTALLGQFIDVHGEVNGQSSPAEVPMTDLPRYPLGDPQNCARADDVNLMSALPGSGWDNLRNVHMGPVLNLQYRDCQISGDRKFILPDDIHAEPLKKSSVQLHSQLMSHFSNYTSVTSSSINVETHASLFLATIGGSFSREHQQAKSKIVNDKTVTSRVELRYNLYKVLSQPNTPLHPALVDRLVGIASYIQADDNVTARYLAELLVRDYGTHYISSVDAGAVIVQEDQVTKEYTSSEDMDTKNITVTASASFLSYFGMSTTYNTFVSQENVNRYRQNCMDSHVESYGGPLYRANFSLDRWIDDLENNLVATDRYGDPLFYVITPENLPQLPVDTVRDLADTVQAAVEAYYSYNVYKGCTSIDSPNFSYIANFDDNSCEAPTNNYTFGGLYQTCAGGACKGHTQVNPKTGDYTCPRGYTAVLLQTETRRVKTRQCRKVGIWGLRKKCWDDWEINSWSYEIFWCAATEKVAPNSGYLFGGTFTNFANNPMTERKTCPDYFLKLTFGYDMKMYVCISDDYELGFRKSVPFAGFFSCSTGNPLALVDQMSGASRSSAESLAGFVYKAGQSEWPKTCPRGFSQHLLAINADCEINYCVKANALTAAALPLIRRPPFNPKPDIIYNATRIMMASDDHIMVKVAGGTAWNKTKMNIHTRPEEIQQFMEPSSEGSGDATEASDSHVGLAVGLSILGTAIVGVVIFVLVEKVRRGRRPQYERFEEREAPDNRPT